MSSPSFHSFHQTNFKLVEAKHGNNGAQQCPSLLMAKSEERLLMFMLSHIAKFAEVLTSTKTLTLVL
jgi:hypothetical protein